MGRIQTREIKEQVGEMGIGKREGNQNITAVEIVGWKAKYHYTKNNKRCLAGSDLSHLLQHSIPYNGQPQAFRKPRGGNY